MKYSNVQLDDLPDEILLMIFKKMYNVEILYSLMGVNERLSQIVHDSVFTSHLTFIKRFSNDSIYPLPISILDRFFFQILPKIHDKIQWLNLAALSIERILLFSNFPNLYGLGLFDLETESAKYLFTDETSPIHKFKNQISSFIIDITQNVKQSSIKDVIKLVFTHIITMFNNLQSLNFCPSSISYEQLSFDMSLPTVISSTLLELHVCLEDITDCLYLLDGRFNQLHTLYVNIYFICSSPLTINNKENLVNLRCFSLYCDNNTNAYDDVIIPLLHRMSNLEKLDLHLTVDGKQTFIDGNELETNIANNMARLNKFTFNIQSTIPLHNQIDFLSNEYTEYTFTKFQDDRIISYVDYLPKAKIVRCHLYTHPYKWNDYNKITNNFPGGLFKYVHEISLHDERPFEHQFFIRIQQSFPLMKKLTLNNSKPQNNKICNKSNNDNEHLSIIEYSHLTKLDLFQAHKDYLEQFLLDTKTSLRNNVQLYINYRPLKKVTHNFTRDATRINCSKIKFPYRNYITRLPTHFKDYFVFDK